MAFVFEHVKESEADKVLSLYRSLVGTPFCAWTADYPARSDVEFDLSRDALLQHVWGWDFAGGSRTVDMHVLTLRQKLGEHASLIETVRGVGYRLVSQ